MNLPFNNTTIRFLKITKFKYSENKVDHYKILNSSVNSSHECIK
jgi:hypothetical protein